jgi:hypothetical protein
VPTRKDLKKLGHKLSTLLKLLKERSAGHGVDLFLGGDATATEEFVEQLEMSYRLRYPDEWPQEIYMRSDVTQLDATYLWLRTT